MVGVDVSAVGKAGPLGPPQSPPVRRPQVIQPHETVDLSDVDESVPVRLYLLYSANHNDPAAYPAVSWDRRWR